MSGRPRPTARPRRRAERTLRPLLVWIVVIGAAAPMVGAASASSLTPNTPSSGIRPFLHNNGVSPVPTAFGSMAYDAADGYPILFGGQDIHQDSLGTTWIFQSGNWTNLTPELSTVPPARWAASMAYDPPDHEVILFGGCTNPACTTALSDTWAFSRGKWTDLTPLLNSSPPEREGAVMTYDAGDQCVLLFGGTPNGSNPFAYSDLWAFRGNQWSPVALASGSPAPPGRVSGTLAYDAALNETVLFGGHGLTLGVLADTWTYRNGSWTNLTGSLASAPSPRRSASMVYDAADGYVILVGGYRSGTYFGDEWTFTGSGWHQISPPGAPPAAYASEIAYDPSGGSVLLFSGVGSDGYYTSTWSYSGGSWTLLVNPPGSGFNAGLVLLGVFLFILILLAVVVAVSSGLRRYRMSRITPAFQIAPTEKVRWIPTGSVWKTNGSALVLGIVFAMVFVLPLALLIGGGADNGLTVLGDVILFAAVPVALALVLFYAGSQSTLKSIGIARSGILVQRRSGETRIPWDSLQPALWQARKGWFAFTFDIPGKVAQRGVVGVTVEQARAIVTDRNAPLWPITPTQASTLGVSPRSAPRPPSTASAPLPSVARPTQVPAGPSPVSPGPLPGGFAVPPPPPYIPAPPPPPPPPPPVAVPTAAPSNAFYVRCAHCGQVFPEGEYAFCPSCGRRVA